MSLSEEAYEFLNYKRLELEEVQLNHDLYRLDEQIKGLEEKYKRLQEDEKFDLIQVFQEKLINLETIELELEDLKERLGIEDDEESDESEDETSEETDEEIVSTSVLDTTNNIINKLQNGE